MPNFKRGKPRTEKYPGWNSRPPESSDYHGTKGKSLKKLKVCKKTKGDHEFKRATKPYGKPPHHGFPTAWHEEKCVHCGKKNHKTEKIPKYIEFLKESNAIECVYGERHLETAIKVMDTLFRKWTLRMEDMLEAHRVLMQDHLVLDAGKWRSCNVRVGDHVPPDYTEIPQLMVQYWVKYFIEGSMSAWVSCKRMTLSQILDAHILFETIHPFVDGNGRIGRILFAWMMDRNGYEVPIWKAEDKYDTYYPMFADVKKREELLDSLKSV